MFTNRILTSIASMFILFYVFILPQNPGLLRNQLAHGILIACGLLAINISQRFKSWALAPAIFYFLARGAFIWTEVEKITIWADLYKGRRVEILLAGNAGITLAAQSFSTLVAILVSVAFIDKRIRSKLLNCFTALCLISSVVLIVRKAFGGGVYFFLNNAAADASMIAVLYPLAIFRDLDLDVIPKFWARKLLSWLIFLLPPLAIAVSGSSTAAGALAVAVISCAIAVRKGKFTRPDFYMAGLVIFIGIVGLLIFTPDGVFSSSGRYGVWLAAMSYWWAKLSVLFGSGSGIYSLAGPVIQIKNGADPAAIFLFMHNEFLQIVWEFGVVGLGLFLTISFVAMRKAFDRPWLFSALFTYGATMLTQFPFRYFASAFIGAILFAQAFDEGEE